GSWNLKQYFVTYQEYNFGERRDRIARLISTLQETKTVVNMFSEPEKFAHQSYKFLAPEVRGINIFSSEYKGRELRDIINVSARPTLLVTPDKLDLDSSYGSRSSDIISGYESSTITSFSFWWYFIE
ncbi:hypothetical protein OAO01_09090, partial [Oligoflexia bacterium]|nr:hypothetical protein [Oligoflexia bacterium]